MENWPTLSNPKEGISPVTGLKAEHFPPRLSKTTKQTELAAQLATAKARLKKLTASDDDSHALIDKALKLLSGSASGYIAAEPELRRVYNQVWYDRILIDDEMTAICVADAIHTTVIDPIYTHARQLAEDTAATRPRDLSAAEMGEIQAFRPLGFHDLSAANEKSGQLGGRISSSKTRKRNVIELRCISHAIGSNIESMVELTGLEPVTCSLRTNRATTCAIAP